MQCVFILHCIAIYSVFRKASKQGEKLDKCDIINRIISYGKILSGSRKYGEVSQL